jgi:hypothetical protein
VLPNFTEPPCPQFPTRRNPVPADLRSPENQIVKKLMQDTNLTPPGCLHHFAPHYFANRIFWQNDGRQNDENKPRTSAAGVLESSAIGHLIPGCSNADPFS